MKMPFCLRFTLAFILLLAVACAGPRPADGRALAAQSQQAWWGEWHGVWQIEWEGAPVRGPLVVEIWHAADGRLRIETLEAPTAALSGLTLVDDGTTVWLHDLRRNRVTSGAEGRARIPLASDALDVVDWLFGEMEKATVTIAGNGQLESGEATRLEVRLTTGDRASLWVHKATGLPARLELQSRVWGHVTLTARSLSRTPRLPPGLFAPPPSPTTHTRSFGGALV